MNYGGITSYPPPAPEKPSTNVVGWVGAVSGIGGFILTLYRDSAQPQSGWLRYVAEGLMGLAVLLGIIVFWRAKISPIFLRRKVLRKAKAKVQDLKGYLGRFLNDVVAENFDTSVFHAVRHVSKFSNGTSTDIHDKTKTGRYLKEIAEVLLSRLAKPMNDEEDIRLAFAAFDSVVRNFGYEFREWRNLMSNNWALIEEYSQNQLWKARELYNNFTDDYNNFRRVMTLEDCGVPGYNFQLPDSFPAPLPRQIRAQ